MPHVAPESNLPHTQLISASSTPQMGVGLVPAPAPLPLRLELTRLEAQVLAVVSDGALEVLVASPAETRFLQDPAACPQPRGGKQGQRGLRHG